jgi:helix-turn-helix protein
VSELPRSAPDAYPSVHARLTGATVSMQAGPLTLVDQGALRHPFGPGALAREPIARVPIQTVLGSGRSRYHDDDMLTVADAARVAHRSVRTLRRAYLAGKLVAHRDGNGRGVTIRYADLRDWLTAELISPAPAAAIPRAIARVNVRARADAPAGTGNSELLGAALRRRGRRARASAAPRPSGRRAGSSQ